MSDHLLGLLKSFAEQAPGNWGCSRAVPGPQSPLSSQFLAVPGPLCYTSVGGGAGGCETEAGFDQMPWSLGKLVAASSVLPFSG